MSDAAEDVLAHVVGALRAAFNPTAPTPPRGGGSNFVRLFAGDAIPLAAWDSHAEGCGCGEPFIWVRLVQRYRSKVFPQPFVGDSNCGLKRVLEIEAGVARCAVLTDDAGNMPSFEDYENEAMISLDDSRRLDAALCRAMKCAVAEDDAVFTALGPTVPWGPQGAVIANVGTAWVQLT